MVKTHKQLLAEIMEREKEKEERKLEFQERIRQIEEKKNKGKKHVVKEPEIIGYIGEKSKGEKTFYGVVSSKITWGPKKNDASEEETQGSGENSAREDVISGDNDISESVKNDAILKKTNRDSKFKSKRSSLEED